MAAVIGSELQVFEASGRRLARQDMHALGFTEDPNDMDWATDRQGVLQAWFFDDAVPRLVRCPWDEERRQLGSCTNAIADEKLKVNQFSRAVHFALDSPGERVFITDAKGGAVQVFDFAGKLLARSERSEVPLQFPNRIRYLGNNTLLVADNDNGRVVWLDASPARPIRFVKSLYASDHGGARVARNRVTDAVVSPTGGLWLLALRMGQKDGDILAFDAAHKPVARAPLPADADPLVIESLGDALLVADFSPVRLYRVDASGQVLGDFGEAALRRELAPLQARGRHAALWMQAAGYAAVAVFLIGVVLTWRYSERPVPPGRIDPGLMRDIDAQRNPLRPIKFPVILKPSTAYLKQVRRQTLWLAAFMVAIVACVAWLLASAFPLADLSRLSKMSWTTIAKASLAILVLPLVLVSLERAVSRTTLRVSERSVTSLRGDRKLAKAPIGTVLASANNLLIGGRLVAIRRPASLRGDGAAVFDLTQLQQAVLSRLPPANLVDDRAVQRELFKRNTAMKLLAALTVALLIGMLGFEVYKAAF